MNEYKVRLEAFSGPLDLLLHLIKKNQLSINNIPMAELTRQYLEYIEESRQLDVEVAGEFLLMASTLLKLKSQTILPKVTEEEFSEDEEEINEEQSAVGQIESQDELVRRLLIYKQFQQASKNLEKLFYTEEKFVKRPPTVIKKILPPKIDSPQILFEAFVNAIVNRSETEQLEMKTENFQVRDKIKEILKMVREREIELFEVVETGKVGEKIAAFLAALELINRGKISARQEEPYEKIFLSKLN